MAGNLFHQIRQALTTLNPSEVREIADRPARIVLYANSEQGYREMERFLVPEDLTERRRAAVFANLYRAGDPRAPLEPEIEIYEQGAFPSRRGYIYYPYDPDGTVQEILTDMPELDLALARNFAPFREPVVTQIIQKVSKENGWFSVLTALPNIVPSALMLPWAVGEFASDSAVLTANQIRMLFLIAAASGSRVGYQEQKSQIASVIAAAFGWRALARQAISKVPMGGGVIPKAAVAYAGTWVVGRSFERFYRLGYGYTESERKKAFHDAFERGREVLSSMLQKHRTGKQPPPKPGTSEPTQSAIIVRDSDL